MPCRELVFDIETDDINATKVWCMSILDIETKQQYSFPPDKLTDGYAVLKAADKLIGHNILNFDIPVLAKLANLDLSDKKVIDTLVLSRLFNPTREGNHGLEGWGFKLKIPKIDFDEYDHYSPEMMKYCERDVYLNYKVYLALKAESQGFSRQSVELEHKVSKILNEQRQTGFTLDVRHATLLIAELQEAISDVEYKVKVTFKPKITKQVLKASLRKDGLISKRASVEGSDTNVILTDEEYALLVASPTGSIVRETVKEFNLGSRKQIGEYLQEAGWIPEKFTPTGQPIVDESVLETVTHIPQAKMIAEYLMLNKRLSQITSWFKELNNDGRVHGYVNPNGTITGRMTHSNPNMAQIPNSGAPYGKECRQCWTVPTGYKLVGIDASGLELRMLAHYMNDKGFINEILNGDIHTANQKLAGLESRNQAKTFIYALIYGAGDGKLGTVVGGSAKDGKRLRESFFDNLPAYRNLVHKVSRVSETKGFVKGLDGRKIYIRSQHAALNSLFQSAGAIVMKEALCLLYDKIHQLKLNAKFVGNIHDEWQIEVLESHADQVGKLGVECIKQAGINLKLLCPLDGEYKIGDNWSETH